MRAFILVTSVSISMLALVGLIGWLADWLEQTAHRRLHPKDRPPDSDDPPFWHGNPPDGDTFP